jgi:NitT/TauT family transport system substrate-binding protein
MSTAQGKGARRTDDRSTARPGLPARPAPRPGRRASRGLRGFAAIATATALLSATLAGCVSSGGGSTTNANGTTTVTIGVGGNIFDVPVNLANSAGYFAKEGIEAKFVTLTSATGIAALQSGSVQFLTASPLDMASAVSKQLPLEAVSVIGSGNPLGLVVSKKFAAAHNLTSTSPAAQVAAALAGSTAGYSSSNTKAEAGIYLKAYGIDSGKENWVELPSPAADKTALSTGQIDWFVTSEPIPLEVQNTGDGIVVANPLTVPQWSAAEAGYGLFTVVKKSYAASDAAVVKKVVAAIQDATNYMSSHGGDSAVLHAAAATMPGIPDTVLTGSLQQVVWPADASMSQADWTKTLAFLNSLGTIQGGANVTSANWTNQYLG